MPHRPQCSPEGQTPPFSYCVYSCSGGDLIQIYAQLQRENRSPLTFGKAVLRILGLGLPTAGRHMCEVSDKTLRFVTSTQLGTLPELKPRSARHNLVTSKVLPLSHYKVKELKGKQCMFKIYNRKEPWSQANVLSPENQSFSQSQQLSLDRAFLDNMKISC